MDFRAPGVLVDVGTHKMHLNCQGHLSPTVVIDSGLGGFSLEWVNIQKQISRYARVCTYDRSGYGWSEPAKSPRTTRHIAKELYLLLTRAGVPGPYVLVGHSFGGYNIRYFASEHPNLVAGMVLVDASHPQQYKRMPVYRKEIVRVNNNSKGYSVRVAIPRLGRNYPEEYRRLAYALMSTWKARITQLAELEHFNESADQVMLNDQLPDVPLTVLTRGMRVWPDNDFGDKSEAVWKELQQELTGLSSNARQVVAYASGHSIHLDQPALVENAIIEMLEMSRDINKLDVLYVRNWATD